MAFQVIAPPGSWKCLELFASSFYIDLFPPLYYLCFGVLCSDWPQFDSFKPEPFTSSWEEWRCMPHNTGWKWIKLRWIDLLLLRRSAGKCTGNSVYHPSKGCFPRTSSMNRLPLWTAVSTSPLLHSVQQCPHLGSPRGRIWLIPGRATADLPCSG